VLRAVHSLTELLKCLLAGASVAKMTSALLKNGIRYLYCALDELEHWMEEHEYSSVRQMQGSMSRQSAPDRAAFARGNYLRVLSSYALRMRTH